MFFFYIKLYEEFLRVQHKEIKNQDKIDEVTANYLHFKNKSLANAYIFIKRAANIFILQGKS